MVTERAKSLIRTAKIRAQILAFCKEPQLTADIKNLPGIQALGATPQQIHQLLYYMAVNNQLIKTGEHPHASYQTPQGVTTTALAVAAPKKPRVMKVVKTKTLAPTVTATFMRDTGRVRLEITGPLILELGAD